MALQQEVWIQDIIETLERDATFLSRMKSLDEFVDKNYIHIPNAGAAPQIFKNVNTFPLTPAQRVDTETLVKLDQYSTQPTLVTDLEAAQLSYSKRDSVMGQHTRILVQNIGDSVLQALTPTAANRTVTIAAGAKAGYADILKVAQMMDTDNVAKNDRHLELPADMFYELLQDEAIYKQYISGLGAVVAGTEAVLRIAGIYLHERASVSTIGGKSAGLAYQKDSVGVAKGEIRVLVDSGDNGNGNPLYNGILMNELVWFGQAVLRSDNKGVVALVRG